MKEPVLNTRHDNSPTHDDLSLVYLFHSNSNYHPDFFAHQGILRMEVEYKEYPSFPTQPLPDRSWQMSSLERIISSRRSCRDFSGKPISKLELSRLVNCAFGTTSAQFRAVPSAGALYPLELYLACINVEGVEPGLYHYNVRDHALELLREKDMLRQLSTIWSTVDTMDGASVVLVFSAVFNRSVDKYGSRGYRFSLMECGMAVEHVALLATEIGFGSLIVGGFFDSRLNSLLGLDYVDESVLCAVVCGHMSTQ